MGVEKKFCKILKIGIEKYKIPCFRVDIKSLKLLKTTETFENYRNF